MKFEKIPKITYYKFQCINKLTNETKLFLHFNSLKEYVDIPRSSFYKISTYSIVVRLESGVLY